MIRIMLDSDNLAALPAGVAPLLATYSDLFRTAAHIQAFEHAHPGSQLVLIDRGLGDPTGMASVIDIETGAFGVGSVLPWMEQKEAEHIADPTTYVSRSSMAAVDAALAGTRFANHWQWIARLDGYWQIPPYRPFRRPAAVQIAPADMTGIDADGSLVYSDAWHRAA